MFARMVRAARLDASFYEMVEADPSTMRESAMVVLLASLANGIGLLLNHAQQGLKPLVIGILATFLSWIIWSALTLFIGTRITRGPETHSGFGEMTRVLGYAHAPRVLSVLVFIPVLGPLLALAGAVWSLVAGIVAIRQALDFSTVRAVITVLLGWLVLIVINILTLGLLGRGSLMGPS